MPSLQPDNPVAAHPAARAWPALGAMAAAAAVYLNALDNPFAYDDFRLIVENRSLVDLNLRALLLQDASRPLVNLSYALDRVVWGPEPFGFHLTSVLLHVSNVGLLWRLAADLTRAGGGWSSAAFAAASLWAVHPMMTQAVGYISGRAEVLCGTFFLLALLAVHRWMRGGPGWWLALAAAGWVLAMASKEIALMLPFIVLACDRWVAPAGSADERRRRLHRLYVPAFALLAAAVFVRGAVFLRVEHPDAPALDWRLALVEADVIRRYLWMLFAPARQSIFHAVEPIDSVFEARALGGIAAVAGLLLASWWMRRAGGVAAVGILWFLLLLVPSSLLVALDRAEPMAEHRVYLASAGLLLTVGVGAEAAMRRLAHASAARRLLQAACLLLLCVFAARSVLRNAVWADPVVLWTEAARGAPGHWLPYIPLGEALHRAGRHQEAADALAAAVRLRPEERSVYGKLGVCLLETGRLEAAAAIFEKLEALDPASGEGPYGLALVAAAQGDTERARQYLRASLEREPDNAAARRALEAIADVRR